MKHILKKASIYAILKIIAQDVRFVNTQNGFFCSIAFVAKNSIHIGI